MSRRKRDQVRELAGLERHAERLDRLECDCGRPKRRAKDEACEQCEFLDGSRESEADLISLLRSAPEGMTLREIGDIAGREPSSLALSLRNMMDRGRVSRFQKELPGKEMTTSRKVSPGARQVLGVCKCWVYQLVARMVAA